VTAHEVPGAGTPAPGPGFDLHWMTDQTTAIILAAVDGDGAAAATTMDGVAGRYGDHGLYCLCCALAEAIVRMAGYRDQGEPGGPEEPGDHWWGLAVESIDTGQPVAPEDLSPDVADMVVAARWVTAYLNGDTAQLFALFDAPDTPDRAALLPLGLLRLVALHGRARLGEDGAR
jgi:hypothetical protein